MTKAMFGRIVDGVSVSGQAVPGLNKASRRDACVYFNDYMRHTILITISNHICRETRFLVSEPSPERATVLVCFIGLLAFPPYVGRMLCLPPLVSHIGFHSSRKIVSRLLEVKHGFVVVGNLARRHEAADLPFSQLFFFAFYRSRRQAHATLVILSRYQDGPSSD
jgi:hypothetical protein